MITRYTYAGRHRAPEVQHIAQSGAGRKVGSRVGAVIAAVLVAVLGFESAAGAAPVTVRWGDTFSGLVATHCGTNDWQSVAFAGRDKNLIYAGETIDISCASTAQTAAPVSAAVATNTGATGWYDPLPGHQPFCNFWQWRGSYNHRGEDIPADYGTPILAAHSGAVWTGWDDGAGNYTVISHPDGTATVYMHQSSYAVWSGWVDGGQVIGYVGSTGDSSGPHLHFEVQPWGAWQGVTNPSTFLRDRGVALGC